MSQDETVDLDGLPAPPPPPPQDNPPPPPPRDEIPDKVYDPVAFNEWAESQFVALLTAYLREHGSCKVHTITRELACALNVSTETIRRYICKHTAQGLFGKSGKFQASGGILSLRSHE